MLINYCYEAVQKYGFGQVHGNSRNTDDITVNAAYILVATNSKTFTIQSGYGDAALFLHYAMKYRSGLPLFLFNSVEISKFKFQTLEGKKLR